MSHIVFEWDTAKQAKNVAKHGITFAEAQTTFTDEFARLLADPDHSHQEDRSLLLGKSKQNRLLVVSHCLREREVIRIISARIASHRERISCEGFRDA